LSIINNPNRYHCPEHYNPADFYLKLVSFAPHGVPAQEAARMDGLATAYRGSDMAVADPIPPDETCVCVFFVFIW
jgi:hypothetical protein